MKVSGVKYSIFLDFFLELSHKVLDKEMGKYAVLSVTYSNLPIYMRFNSRDFSLWLIFSVSKTVCGSTNTRTRGVWQMRPGRLSLLYSETEEMDKSNIQHVRAVLQFFRGCWPISYTVSLKKCAFHWCSTTFQGVAMEAGCPLPKMLKQLQRFLGFANFC